MSENSNKPKYLKKVDIVSAPDLAVADVDVPEWGGVVRVRALSAAEDAADTRGMLLERNGQVMMASDGKTPLMSAKGIAERDIRLAAMAIIDENGERMFSDAELAQLGGKNKAALDRIVAKAKELSGIKDDATLLENLDSTPSDDSGSD